MAARSRPIPSECAGVRGGRCEGGGAGKPERRGRVLRERKLETESVPAAGRPGPGSGADTGKCSCTAAPHRAPPACPTPDPSSPGERGPPSVRGSRVAATGRRVRTPGRGPKAAAERGAPRALAAFPARRPSSLLAAGLAPDRGAGRPLGLRSPPGPRRRGLARPGAGGAAEEPEGGAAGRARRARWARGCEAISAPGMRAGAGGAQPGDPVRWPPAAGVRWDSVLFPKAFWRVGYKRVQFTFSVFRLY